MNKLILMGRFTKDPEVRYSSGDNPTAVANFSLAVDKRFKKDGQETADFFNCTAFGKQAEFIEKYMHKGSKILWEGRVENNNYTNREGAKVYGFRFITENVEFAESKAASERNAGTSGSGNNYQPQQQPQQPADSNGYMTPDDDEELPFV